MNLLRIFAVAIVSVTLAAPVASAQTPAKSGYDETGVLPQLPAGNDVVPPPQGGVLDVVEQGNAGDKLPSGRAPSVNAVPSPGSGNAAAPVRRELGAPTVKAGTLPFTGLDVGIVALLGMLLVGTGFALRRTRSVS